MKRQFYILPGLILLSGAVWADGYLSGYRSNPYAGYGNPYRPPNQAINPYPANTPQIYNNQGYYQAPVNNNPYVQNPVPSPYVQYRNPNFSYSANTPYTAGSPYTPYSTPNPHGAYINPYARDLNDAPYERGNVAVPYGIYGNSYRPNSNPANTPYTAASPYPQNPYANSNPALYDANNPYNINTGNNPPVLYGSPYGPNSAIYPYTAGEQQFYGNPYSSGSFNNSYQPYGLDNSQTNPYEQGLVTYGQ